jgi:AraC-like DNA-binding protein
LAPWRKRRASELLHENMHGRIRLSDIARECGLSVSHFARSFNEYVPRSSQRTAGAPQTTMRRLPS